MKQSAVLFVCLGNICRSPTAEGVMRTLVASAGLQDAIRIDSAGTGDWFVGRPPHEESVRYAASKGYDMADLRGRQVTEQDFDQFDYILAMDRQNLAYLELLRPDDYSGHLGLFLAFNESLPLDEVPDPFGGDAVAFRNAFELIEQGAGALLEHIRRQS